MNLAQLELKGYKSFHPHGQKIDFGPITILLGANGSGKSNLVSFFKMLNYITTGGLQTFIGMQGTSNSLLYYGPKRTDKIDWVLKFTQGQGQNLSTTSYEGRLTYGMPDRLFFSGEKVSFSKSDKLKPQEYYLDIGGSESALSKDERKTSKVLFSALASIRAYQFHDTSDTAKIKANGYVDDARYLRSDAGNLAAFLRRMKSDTDSIKYYERIIRHIRKVMPQFEDFDLEPISLNQQYVRLNWVDKTRDYLFGPHQISDGSLRFMALTALLLKPPEKFPGVIVLDEPELGLHPLAIAELAGMIRTASKHSQVIIATQSTRLVDEFDVDNLVIVEVESDESGPLSQFKSQFKRLDADILAGWLARYSLAELWEKNVFGGQP